MIHFKDNKNKSALSTRWAQMSKQEQIIERKKMEIQAKLEAQKQAAALAAQAKLSNPTVTTDEKGNKNIFSNDGSFMSQFKALLEKQKQDTKEKEELEKQSEENVSQENNEEGLSENEYENEYNAQMCDERRQCVDQGQQRDKNRRWGDRDRNHPHSPTTVADDRNNPTDNTGSSHNIPSLMQIPIMPPNNQSSDSEHKPWMVSPNSDDDQDNSNEPPSLLGPLPMGPLPMPPGLMAPSLMGPLSGIGPGQNMGPGSNMGPGPNMGSGPNMGFAPNMGSGHSTSPGPNNMGPGANMGPGPNMGQAANMGVGPNMGPGTDMGPGPLMGPRGPMPPMPPGGHMPHGGHMPPGAHIPPGGQRPPMPPGGPMPPFMGGPPGGPPNFSMPPNFMGPNGPCGPMPPNMCGPNGPGPNGPMPPFFGPPFPNPMMGPNGPPNSMNNNNMPFMGPRPPFPRNGPPNFGNGPPMPFMPPNPPLPPNTMSGLSMPDSKFDKDSMNIPPLPPMSKNDMDNKSFKSSQVLADMPPAVHRAASEVACNGDHWENVLKAIHTQDQSLWFLHNTNSNEYKAFRELIVKYRSEQGEKKPEVKPEDKYEPEFSLEDDESNEEKPYFKEERDDFPNQRSQYPYKREQASSQSDEESDTRREKRKKKKSRWSDDPPAADIKPPGVVAPLPSSIGPGGLPSQLPQLAKIDEEGIRLGAINRNNQALMQYALTNYGTTNLSGEDWKKCEDNFKLNLLYQDMLKKRQEVERLAAAGKYKYEYDSDEDTSEGTWEHKLRAKEMNATEKWATELTKQAAGKHHIGDFLPPEELKKFMEKYSAVKSGKEPDLSDYKEFKLKEDNVGFKMLQKLGWTEGQGLGAEGSGIVEPVNKANQPVANLGLGANTSDVVSPEDDEFDAYRKRMMLAYRFRPNPLNNPRRPYY